VIVFFDNKNPRRISFGDPSRIGVFLAGVSLRWRGMMSEDGAAGIKMF
jgi:hypothetical protein